MTETLQNPLPKGAFRMKYEEQLALVPWPFKNYWKTLAERNRYYNHEFMQAFGDGLENEPVLEAGCGESSDLTRREKKMHYLVGIDPLPDDILKNEGLKFKTLGVLEDLPFCDSYFAGYYSDSVYEHIDDPSKCCNEAFRVLKKGGALAIIGHDPHEVDPSNWYIYNYFEGVYETDLRRYPSGKSVVNWMIADGFQSTSVQVVEKIVNIHVGDGVFNDPFIKHNATSQLALLSEDKYLSGLKKIREALEQARAGNERLIFRSQIDVKMFLGYKA